MDDLISRKAAIEALKEAFNPSITNFVKAKMAIDNLPSAQPDLSEYSDKLWKAAYERGKAEAQPDLEEAYICGETEAEARYHAEIVRCKDCKYWMPHSQLGFDEDNGTYHDYCAKLVPEDEYYAFYRNADDYCSRAERRTDEE